MKKKDTEKAKEIASKPESTAQSSGKDQTIVPSTSDTTIPMETNFDSSQAGGISTVVHSQSSERDKSVCYS